MSEAMSEAMSDRGDGLAEILARRDRGDGGIVEVDAATVQLAVFAIGDRLFAFPGAQVAEILPLGAVHYVPGCPPALEGVIDVRGEIWSVIRLGDLVGALHRSGLPEGAAAGAAVGSGSGARAQRGRGVLLLGRAGGMESALRVDEIVDVRDCLAESVLPPPDTLPEPLQPLATGVFQSGGASVVVLDMERLFAAWREGRV